MNAQSFAPIKLVVKLRLARLLGGLLLALAGCSRSTVVLAPEELPRTDVSARSAGTREDDLETSGDRQLPVAGFAFPEDASGQLLAKLLPPKDVETTWPERTQPRRFSASALLKPPDLPLPPSPVALLRWPEDHKRSPLRPHLILEETLGELPDAPRLPQSPPLPDNGRIRVPSPDVNQPIPLPILSRPVSDRTSLDDPTLDASTAAATAAPIPPRTSKAPFLKQTLPDPYDHRRTGVPAPEESKDFPLGSPQSPRH